MQKKPANEFSILQCDRTPGIAGMDTSGGECRGIRPNGLYPAVGDGDFVGVLAEILDGIAESVEGLLDVGTPVLTIQAVAEAVPLYRIFQITDRRRYRQLTVTEECFQVCEELASELVAQDFYGYEEAVL